MMLRFVDMQAAGIAGVRFGFWDTDDDEMLSLDGDQGWDTFDDLRASASRSNNGHVLPLLAGLCPSWVHAPTTTVGAVADALHRLGARSRFGEDLRLCIDGAVYDALQELLYPEDDTPRELLLARLAAAMLAELGDEWAARASADEDEPAPKTCRHGGVYRGERCGACGEMVG